VRAAVAGRMGYIVPGVVNEEEVDLATQIGLPLMGPAPTTTRWVLCGHKAPCTNKSCLALDAGQPLHHAS